MNKKTLKILEFEKIINSLVDMAGSEPAKKLCSKLKPSTDITEIQKNQSHTLQHLTESD